MSGNAHPVEAELHAGKPAGRKVGLLVGALLVGLILLVWSVVLPVLGILYLVEHLG